MSTIVVLLPSRKDPNVHHNSGEHGFYVADSLKIKMGFKFLPKLSLLCVQVCTLLFRELGVLGEHMQFHLRHSSIDRLK